MVVMPSTLGTYFGPNVFAFGAGLLGVICAALGRAYRSLREHLDRTAYRFAGITLAITMPIVRPSAVWLWRSTDLLKFRSGSQ